jgi:hypothetical protein
MAGAVRDPGTAEQHDLTPQEVELLQAAAQGDPKAAQEIGFTPSDHQTFMNLLSETSAIDEAEEACSRELLRGAATQNHWPRSCPILKQRYVKAELTSQW